MSEYFKSHEIDKTINFLDYNSLHDIAEALEGRHFVYKEKLYETVLAKVLNGTKLLVKTYSTPIVIFLSEAQTIRIVNIIEPKTGKKIDEITSSKKLAIKNERQNMKSPYSLTERIRILSRKKGEKWSDIAAELNRNSGGTIYQKYLSLTRSGVTIESLQEKLDKYNEKMGIKTKKPEIVEDVKVFDKMESSGLYGSTLKLSSEKYLNGDLVDYPDSSANTDDLDIDESDIQKFKDIDETDMFELNSDGPNYDYYTVSFEEPRPRPIPIPSEKLINPINIDEIENNENNTKYIAEKLSNSTINFGKLTKPNEEIFVDENFCKEPPEIRPLPYLTMITKDDKNIMTDDKFDKGFETKQNPKFTKIVETEIDNGLNNDRIYGRHQYLRGMGIKFNGEDITPDTNFNINMEEQGPEGPNLEQYKTEASNFLLSILHKERKKLENKLQAIDYLIKIYKND